MLVREAMLFRFLLLAAVASAGAVRADPVQRMTARLSEEAAAFARIAPDVIGTETLRQRAIEVHHRRFHPHIVDPDEKPRGPEWQNREIVSEYSYSTLSDNPAAIREFRRVLTVDGRRVTKRNESPDLLAKSIRSGDDRIKHKLLEQFEKFGLIGTVTDFGQIILLFEGRNIEQYEFSVAGTRMMGADSVTVFRYKQIDGPDRLTVWDGSKETRQKTDGEIWVRQSDYMPLRITLNAERGLGQHAVREEAVVDYTMSPFGALLPVSVLHREYRAGALVAENRFSYSNFRKFGASTSIVFPVATPPPSK
jgi:hypothetical protein